MDLEFGYYEWACFTAQQAAEKMLKALGLKLGDTLWGHDLTEILKWFEKEKGMEIPSEAKEAASTLDLYYIPARYPNGWAAGKPADHFTEKKAEEALRAADILRRFCEDHFP